MGIKVTVLAWMLATTACSSGGEESSQVQPGGQVVAASATAYPDQRPAALFRLPAQDAGIVLKHGDREDILGARDAFVFESAGTFYLHYDGATANGWVCALATSTDLVNWQKRGSILPLGKAGQDDSASASYCTIYQDAATWHMFYLGTPNTSGRPDYVPGYPYLTMKATSPTPDGPWTKDYAVVPFRPVEGSYYSRVASPGHVVKDGDTFLQFFSSTARPGVLDERSIGIARTKDLDGAWQVDATPILPTTEQIENSSLYYQASDATWFLFTNHVAIDAKGESYTDAIWVYWTKDLNRWDASQKAVVLDAANSSWSRKVIGLPSVIAVGDRLAILYDGQAADHPTSWLDPVLLHMKRDIGLAWLDLPIRTP